MKTKLFLSVACFAFAVSCKKSNDANITPTEIVIPVTLSAVPSTVVNTFNSRFAGATQVEWFSVSLSTNLQSREFEVEFNHVNQRHEARFDDNGGEKHHNISCISDPVPQVVLTSFRSTHPNDTVYEWNLRNDGTWKAHFLRGTVKWEATYTAAGVLVKEEHD
jgi:hypothetical protein